MAKNNFKAKEATDSADFAHNVGTLGQGAMGTGIDQQGQGFSALKDTLGQQKSFAQMLQDAAAGTGGPTMADQQIKDATARNNANAAGFAAGAKGLNPALAARQALMAQAGNNQQAAGQAAQTRIQEQQAARAQLGGALAGEAGTAGGMTSAGQGLMGTGGQLANQSNANLIQSRGGANQINADVAKQNAGAINGAISGVMNAAGAAFGLAEGGEVPGEPEGTQNPETEIALAYGGGVGHQPALPSSVHSPAQPRRSFAAQVAHHLAREYFDEGGEAGHGSYDFQPMDLRSAKGHKPAPKTESGASTTMFIPHDYHPSQPSDAQHEGQDSEGKAKPSINRAFGGDVSEQEYDETDDNPEADNEPDTDQSTDPGEAGEHFYAEGGDISAGGGDESAGISTVKPQLAQQHPAVAATPGIFGTLKQNFNASPMGKLLNPGSDQAALARGVNVNGAAAPTGPAAAPQKQRSGPLFNFADGGETPVPVKGLDRPMPIRPEAAAALEADPDGAKMSPHLRNATGRTHASGGKQLKTTISVREPGQQPAVARFDAGGPVPGRAPMPGNTLKNDVVDAKLSPGEVVLPRTISHDPKKAKRFVELLQDGHNGHTALAAIKGKRS